jgi:hypothetical protein
MRAGVMGAIVVALLGGVWLGYQALFSGGCDGGYCPAGIDVDPPQGFAFASDIYEFRGELPTLPEGGSIEIDIPLEGGLESATGLSFYRYLPESSAWEHVATATIDESGERAVGSFQGVPETIVLMQRSLPAGHVSAFIDPGQQIHPAAMENATLFHTRDFSPGGDGSINGQLTALQLEPGQEHYPVISASPEIDGSVPNLDAILETSATRTSHVQHIAELVVAHEVDGITIDYSALRDDQRTSFSLLIEELGIEMERQGKGLAVVAPPPLRTPERIEPGPVDWEVIGAAADFIVLEPIRDQSTYRRDLPLILDYLHERVPPRKILLGITPYAAERSEDVRRLTLVEAMRIATQIEVGDTTPATNDIVELRGVNIDQTEGRLSGLLWDTTTATVAFTYRENGGRTVWLENVFSVSFKLEFVTAYGLGGFSVEDASNNEMLGNIWPALVRFVETGQPTLLQPGPEELEPEWEVSGGSLEGGQRGVARWTTPSEPGTYTVRLTVSDGSFRFENEIQVTVEARDQD